MFTWERKDWPRFTVEHAKLLPLVSSVRLKQGKLLGAMAQLGFDVNLLAQLNALTEDALKSSEIEGETLDRGEVRSSLARRLGVDQAGLQASSAKVDGLTEMLVDATSRYAEPLTRQRLCGWHAALFPSGYSGIHPVNPGQWRRDAEGPMQVISGAVGRERVHYEAPPAARVDEEMRRFLQWFNGAAESHDPLRAALAHLWFVSIHPFEDGNGRIARAISDMALAQSEGCGQRFYSMSSQIRAERRQYYEILEKTQRGGADVTPWASWFLECLGRALDNADRAYGDAMRKAAFWQRYPDEDFNERQRKVLNRMLDGLEGNLTAPKWARLAKCSPATAQRDIARLVEQGVLVRGPGGSKNTHYSLAE